MTAINTRQRRRAYRAPGPAGETAADIVVRSDGTEKPTARVVTPPTRRPGGPLGPPPRRPAHTRLVTLLSLGVGVLVVAVLVGVVAVLSVQQHQVRAELDHEQQFVDTAAQMVVNMFSFTQDTVEESVNRFVNSTSGPLRDMLMHDNNTENLKAMFRDTNASSEAVINGAALESHDPVGRKAAVLVSVRVTVTDIDGVNKPSQPYRMRVIVHEDDNGHMTGYDLMYPDGGN